jgi:hypothetical protein
MGMARLLQKIWAGDALSKPTATCSDIIPAARRAPPHQGPAAQRHRVMHKTGSLGIGVANDVGIVRLPGAGTIMTIFVKESQVDAPAGRDRAGRAPPTTSFSSTRSRCCAPAFHPRTSALCEGQNWRRWAGYLAAVPHLTHDREH